MICLADSFSERPVQQQVLSTWRLVNECCRFQNVLLFSSQNFANGSMSFVRSVPYVVCFCSAVTLNSKPKGFPLHAQAHIRSLSTSMLKWLGGWRFSIGECMWEGMRMRVRLYEKSAQLLLFAFFHLHIVLSFRPVVLDARSIAHAEWVVLREYKFRSTFIFTYVAYVRDAVIHRYIDGFKWLWWSMMQL